MNRRLENVLIKAGTISYYILKFLYKAGEATLDFYIDNVSYSYNHRYRRQSVYNSFQRLEEKGYIKSSISAKGQIVYRLAEPTSKELIAFEKLQLQHPKKQKWDGNWYLVVFDIPETKKKYRDSLRWRLKSLGLELFQQSIWLSPYPLTGDFYEIVKEAGIGKLVKIIETDKLPEEEAWIKKFGLEHQKSTNSLASRPRSK